MDDITLDDVKDDFVNTHKCLSLWEEGGAVSDLINAERFMRSGEKHFHMLWQRSRKARRFPTMAEQNEQAEAP